MQCNDMGCKKTVSARVDPDWKERIEDYQDQQGYETRSDAAVDLLKTGYREKQHPLLYRAKKQSKDVAVYLPMTAATVAIIGQVTEVLAATMAVQIAVVLICLALTPLALVESVQRARDRLQEVAE